ncbi:enoyl-CoA hydratase [Evansella tamaricis]|uniref:Enoyl-CoA hydratase n=1 Tax=Evansella tamaricis TaxID=2069301 RepID=A0ABS6JDL5_9BACI|nr:enoyl-CoA hydratase [Evansella tamaricis]MBU9710947.1 enoyl-CoA hydratase [Evansella tamaricis]
MGTLIKVSKEDNIGIITLNHPPANTLSQAMIQEIETAFDQLKEETTVKVILLHGEGRFFAAGADIKEFTKVDKKETFQEMSRKGQEVFSKIEAFPKPVIAVIHGAALGGGLELAMACHIRFVSTDAKLGLPELQLGLIPGFAGTQRLPKLVGKAKATELLLSSDTVMGEEAVQIGLANRCFPPETVLGEGKALARKIALKGSISVRRTLELISLSNSEKLEVAQQKESLHFGEVAKSEDATEGIQAFIEKRKPVFKDR